MTYYPPEKFEWYEEDRVEYEGYDYREPDAITYYPSKYSFREFHLKTTKLLDHPLYEVFNDAIDQAREGKGMERHGTSEDFEKQPLYDIAKLTGPRGPMYQVFKKTHEAVYCLENGTFTPDEAYTELLGAIVYLGALAQMVKK